MSRHKTTTEIGTGTARNETTILIAGIVATRAGGIADVIVVTIVTIGTATATVEVSQNGKVRL
ncbi:MAG TPA: hypothetical protein VLQ90_09170 [Pyrinomonadaceae bacterium]|nr:hypothetical protein [Pyrinomonadaceae bacterium]